MNIKKTATALAIITGLSVGGVELEQSNQLKNIHAKTGVNIEMVYVATQLSESHRRDIETALVKEYEKDGYVDYDNYELHLLLINNHFEELKENNNLPDWYSDISELTESEIITNIHNSLKNK